MRLSFGPECTVSFIFTLLSISSRFSSCLTFFAQVLFLASHTLINELFLSLPSRPFTLPLYLHHPAATLARIPSYCSSYFAITTRLFLYPRKSPFLFCSFSHGNHEQSRQSTLLDALQLLAFCYPFSLRRLFSFFWPAFFVHE